jgi:hypothetical protein
MTRTVYKVIKQFAATAGGPLELVEHRPEPWAVPMGCFQNVRQKVSRDGGTGLSGWHFLMRHSPEHGDYLIATHHSIWQTPGSPLIDITPFHEHPGHQPLTEGRRVIFLADSNSTPIVIGDQLVPQPSQFIPLNYSRKLADYLAKLSRKEVSIFEENCEIARQNP